MNLRPGQTWRLVSGEIESNHRPAFDELLKEFIVSIVKETLAEERKTRNKR